MPKGYTKQDLDQLYNSFIGMRQGRLTVIRPATPEENKSRPGESKWWLCKCECGNEIFVKTAYLQGNAGRGDYKIESCGCLQKIRHFLASSTMLDKSDEQWLYGFYQEDWEKFQILHQCIVRTSGIKTNDWKSKDEYKQFYESFWNDKQFNAVYNFWINHKNQNNTFYDWSKPSLDHIVPKGRGGTNNKNNLQFLTVFENLSKRDMTMDEWNAFKVSTNTKSDFFIENILKGDD